MAKKIKANTSVNDKETYLLSNIEAKLLGIDENEDKAFIILKYFDGDIYRNTFHQKK